MRNPHFKSNRGDEVCNAVFATDTLGFSPEFFARTGGELYLAGLNSTMLRLPDFATEVKPSEEAIEQLKACAKIMLLSVPGKELELLREGLVCPPKAFHLGTQLIPTIVLPSRHFKRTSDCLKDTRREARRHKDKRR